MSKLSERLAQRKVELNDVSLRAVSARAKADGHDLSINTVSKYLKPRHPNPSRSTLEALASGFQLPSSEVYKLAGLPTDTTEFEPHQSADLLTAPQRDAVNEIIRLLADGNRRAGESGADSTSPMNQAGGKPASNVTEFGRPLPADVAALRGESEGVRQWEEAQERGEESQASEDDE